MIPSAERIRLEEEILLLEQSTASLNERKPAIDRQLQGAEGKKRKVGTFLG
jgi:hypothetical protein